MNRPAFILLSLLVLANILVVASRLKPAKHVSGISEYSKSEVEWNDYSAAVQVAVTDESAPPEFLIKVAPLMGQDIRYVHVTTMESPQSEGKVFREVVEGHFRADPGDEAGIKISVNQDVRKMSVAGETGFREMRPCHSVVLLKNGRSIYGTTEDAANLRLDIHDLSGGEDLFTVDLPQESGLTVGMKWSVPAPRNELDIAYEILGFSAVGDSLAVRMNRTRKRPFRLSDVFAAMQIPLPAGVGDQSQLLFVEAATVYVALDSGIVLRSESEITFTPVGGLQHNSQYPEIIGFMASIRAKSVMQVLGG